DHVGREPQLVVLRAHADDHEVVGLPEGVDQLLHQPDVCRAQASQAEIDRRARAAGYGKVAVWRADARAETLPGTVERSLPLVVGHRRVEIEVEKGRLMDELPFRQLRSPTLDEELAELALQGLVQLSIARAELVPARAVGGRVAREGRR